MGREVCRTEMEVRASLQKVSGSSDSVATENSEEFVLVPQHTDDTSTKDDGKPQLKVFFFFLIWYYFSLICFGAHLRMKTEGFLKVLTWIIKISV